MKSVSELGLTTWGEVCKSLEKAGFEPHHLHQVVNSKDNKLAKALFELFERRGGEIVLRLMHQDRAGRVYDFPWKEGLRCAEIARILTFSDAAAATDQLTETLISKGMTYSQAELDRIIELSDSTKGDDLPEWEQSIQALWNNCVSCLFFVHNEDKTEVSIVYLANVYGTMKDDKAVIKRYSLDHIINQEGCEICGWNYDDEDYSITGIFINVQ
jgi:hypothetical protein